jgi:hypothetical protein
MAAAMGLRQMFPVQTITTRNMVPFLFKICMTACILPICGKM